MSTKDERGTVKVSPRTIVTLKHLNDLSGIPHGRLVDNAIELMRVNVLNIGVRGCLPPDVNEKQVSRNDRKRT